MATVHPHAGAVMWGCRLLGRALYVHGDALLAVNSHSLARIEGVLEEFRTDVLNQLSASTLEEALGALHKRVEESLPRSGAAVAYFLSDLAESFAQAVQSEGDAFDDMFAAALAATVTTYEAYGVPVDLPRPAVGLDTVHSRRDVHEMGQGPQISGSYPGGGSRGAATRVKLRVKTIALDFAALRVIPYALFHELVSHVFQGRAASDAAPPGPKDTFAEGWMDRVASIVHEQVMRGWGPANGLRREFDDPPGYLAAGTAHHARRTRKTDDPNWVHRKLGAAAFETLQNILAEDLGQQAEAALDRALELSCHLNASDTPLAVRSNVVTLIRGSAPNLQPRPNREELMSALATFFTARDLGPLLELANR